MIQKDGSIGSNSVTVLIPGAQTGNRTGYIHISEDPSVQGHPLWCSKCQHGNDRNIKGWESILLFQKSGIELITISLTH